MRRRVIDYLAKFGLDAREISADDYDSSGFRLMRLGADREKVHPWPEGFNFDWFVRLVHAAWQEDMRLARKNRVIH